MSRINYRMPFFALVISLLATPALALPVGYVKTTIPLAAPHSGLAYAAPGSAQAGTLFAFEKPNFGTNTATIRVINPDLTFGTSLAVTSLDSGNFFIGGMAFDPVTEQLLVTDNGFGASALYSINTTTSARAVIRGAGSLGPGDSGIPSIAGVAVRSTGEIVVSTAPFADNAGQVLQVDRATGTTTTIIGGLDFGAGLAFDSNGDLLVQEADFNDFTQGRLHRVTIDDSGPTLQSAGMITLATGLAATAGLALDGDGDLFATGAGGLYELSGSPLVASLFDTNGELTQFSTAIAFYPGANPFEPFQTGGGFLAYQADFGQFNAEDEFITLITPENAALAAVPEPGTFGLLLVAGGLALLRRRAAL